MSKISLYPLTDELTLAINDDGFTIYTSTGHIHMMHKFGEKVSMSKNFEAALKQVYTPKDNLHIDDLIDEDKTLH